MNRNWLNNPDNFWGKWLELAKYKQFLALFSLIFILLYLPAKSLITNYQKLAENISLFNELQSQLAHKQRLLQSLKQQSDSQLLTPELASKLLPINHSVQNLSPELQINLNQWIFQTKPQLKLQIQGTYLKLKNFISTLLQQHSNLKLISLQIEKFEQTDYSIESEIIFQLEITKENL